MSILHCIQLSISNSSLLFFATSRSLADGVQSDISLIHPDDINWFLTTDETHHPFSTEGNKGGSTAQRYSTNSFHRSGERCLQSATHTTGCMGQPVRGILYLRCMCLALMQKSQRISRSKVLYVRGCRSFERSMQTMFFLPIIHLMLPCATRGLSIRLVARAQQSRLHPLF